MSRRLIWTREHRWDSKVGEFSIYTKYTVYILVTETLKRRVFVIGMRGKKDVSDSMSNEKRAPAPGFFGMRGKKGPIVSTLI